MAADYAHGAASSPVMMHQSHLQAYDICDDRRTPEDRKADTLVRQR
jgi:hypothetical protein